MDDPAATLSDQFKKCNATIALFKIHLNQLSQTFKQIEKNTAKELKAKKRGDTLLGQKAGNPRNSKKKKGEPKEKRNVTSGMAAPRLLSDALCVFLDVPAGTLMSRPDVTKRLNQYIKENGLYSKEHKRLICDARFGALMDLDSDPDLESEFVLTHFTMQRCMNKHYIAS